MKKVIIVNKFGPSSNAVTGQNAKEMADFLSINNLDVSYICLGSEYRSAKIESEQPEIKFRVKELREFYNGNTPYLRFFWSFFDGFRLWLSCVKQKADTIIVMTDPPLLFFWFQLFRRFSKSRIFYWAMDIYPDAFVAGKYLKPGDMSYRFFSSIVYRKVPDLIIALGNKQLDYLEKKFNSTVSHIILPCGIIERKPLLPNTTNTDGKISFCYGGNIGEAHDADFLIALINQLDPEKHKMLLSLYGSKAEYVKRVIKNTKVVEFKKFLNQSDIASIDVNVATLLPAWNHICVPSKAVTAICCGSSLLLNASKEADAWQMFMGASWLIEAGENYEGGIRRSLEAITQNEISQKKVKAKELAQKMVSIKGEALKAIVLSIKNREN